MSFYPATDLAGAVKSVIASAQQDSSGDPIILTAAATEDGVKITGETIDRQGADSLVLAIGWITKLTAAKTLAFAVEEQQSADDSSWDTATVVEASTVKSTGAGTELGVSKYDVNLRTKKRYVRYNITPDLSHSSTDTALWGAVATLGGYDEEPQSS